MGKRIRATRRPLPAASKAATLADRLDHALLRRAVRERYSLVASEPETPLGFPVGRAFAAALGYPDELLERAPDAAASFTGVGTPVRAARLQPGEIVLDLGCGAGLDSVWAAQQLQPAGRLLALDMALPMVRALQRSLDRAAVVGVQPLVAEAEALPLAAASVDVVLVNGIFNLSPDKSAVMREVRRVLRPGGRLAASEVVLSRPLAAGEASSLDDWFRWIGGALPEASLLEMLEAHQLGPVTVVERSRNARTQHPASLALTFVAGPSPR